MKEVTRTILQRVLITLEEVEVHGKENLDRLLGAMMVLEQIINDSEEADNGESDG